MLKKILLLSLLILNASCSTKPDRILDSVIPEPEIIPIRVELEKPIAIKTLSHFMHVREQAYIAQDWVAFIDLSETIWHTFPEAQNINHQQDTYNRLKPLSAQTLETLAEHPNELVRYWSWLVQTQNMSGLALKRALEDLQQITTEAMFNFLLMNILLADVDAQLSPPSQIAVLLPLSGRLEVIGKQIRAGVLKAYWHNNTNIQLKFYDTVASESIPQLYRRAINNGAEKIIGPLTREEVAQLTHIAGPELVALNRLDTPSPFIQLNLNPSNEIDQIIEHINQRCFQHIALISSDQSNEKMVADQFQKRWDAQQKFNLIKHNYPNATTNLRHEMNQLVNIQFSQNRAGFLSRVIGKPIEHTPRSRQDIDALILLGSASRVAELQPQVEFNQLDLPIISTSQLTPDALANTTANRDLKNIQFPTYPASLYTSPITNKLEALGWDGFILAHSLNKLQPGMFLHGSLGKHQLNPDNSLNTQLSWARYQNNGELTRLVPNQVNNFYYTNPKDARPTQPTPLRKELLEDIINYEF